MSAEPHHSDPLEAALRNARRLEVLLREQREDFARKRPDDAQGGEALRDAALAVERVAKLLADLPGEPLEESRNRS